MSEPNDRDREVAKQIRDEAYDRCSCKEYGRESEYRVDDAEKIIAAYREEVEGEMAERYYRENIDWRREMIKTLEATQAAHEREVEGLRAALEKAGNILCGLGHDRAWIDAALAKIGISQEALNPRDKLEAFAASGSGVNPVPMYDNSRVITDGHAYKAIPATSGSNEAGDWEKLASFPFPAAPEPKVGLYEAAKEMSEAVALLPADDGRILGLLPVLCRLRAALAASGKGE